MKPVATFRCLRNKYSYSVWLVSFIGAVLCQGCGTIYEPLSIAGVPSTSPSPSPVVYKIYAGGSLDNYNSINVGGIGRLNMDGSLDSSFLPTGSGVEGQVSPIQIDSSGRPIVAFWGGGPATYNGTNEDYIARLNTDGSLDTSFSFTGTGIDEDDVYDQLMIYADALDSSGRIVVGGTFTSYNSTSEPYILRLNTDGSLDNSFSSTGTGLNGKVEAVAIDSSGRIIVGGSFSSYNGTPLAHIARLNSDGSLDTSFSTTGTGLNADVFSIAIDSSGKIVTGGFFTSYNGTSISYVVRLNSNGSLDTTFAPVGTGLSSVVQVLAIDPSGKIVVGGGFTSYNGTPESYVARLNTDGSLDSSFNPVGTGLDNYVWALAIDPNGKIITAGQALHYNGISEPDIARLNADGSLDTTFNSVGTGFDYIVFSLAISE